MRTLVEAARALCYGGNLPADLWEHAMHYYVYVHNLTTRKELDGKTSWGISIKRPLPSLPKFYFGGHVTCYVDDKRRQTTAAKRVDPLGKMQLPSREHAIFVLLRTHCLTPSLGDIVYGRLPRAK